MELLDDVGHVEARFSLFGDSANLDARYLVCLEIVLILTRCTVCAKPTIGSEIGLDASDGTPR
jgi:hypothetical protein